MPVQHSLSARIGFVTAVRGFLGLMTILIAAPAHAGPLGAAGDLYVNDATNTVRQFDGATGAFVATFATGLSDPRGMMFGPNGNLFVADASNHRIAQFDGATGAALGTFAASTATVRDLIFSPSGDLFVTDDGQRVLRFNGTTGALIGTFVTGLSDPRTVDFGPNGNLVVADASNHRVAEFDASTGAFVRTFASTTSTVRRFTFGGPSGNLFLSADSQQVIQFDRTTGALIGTFIGSGLADPRAVEFGPNGNLFVADASNNRVAQFDGTTGAAIGTFIGGLSVPRDMTFKPTPPDCNSNGIADNSDIAGVTSTDCNTNAIPDDCDLSAGTGEDCNTNELPDACDLFAATSADCNGSDVPDECELASASSDDCNSNQTPDECDTAGPTSDDCNGNQIPDECDTAGGTSDDCNGNSTPDDCEPASGNAQWSGASDGDFGSGANWTPSSVPGTAGNAILSNSTATDNRCILNSGSQTIVCSVSVNATGSGRQILQINAGSTLLTNDSTSVSIGGDIDLRGGELAGGPVTNSSNSIQGYGAISADLINSGRLAGDTGRFLEIMGTALDNQAGGTIAAPGGAIVRVRSPDVLQSGLVQVRPVAGIFFDTAVTNFGEIELLGGAMGAGGLTNAVGGLVTGFGSIDSSVLNNGHIVLLANTEIIGDLQNEGTITIQSGLLTVTGNLSGNGAIIGMGG